MFVQFFYLLKGKKIPVSTTELLDLLKTISVISAEQGYLNLERLHSVMRCCLIKDVKYYDEFDLLFSEYFGKLDLKNINNSELLDWLTKAKEKNLSEEQKQNAMNLGLEELIEELKKRLEEQKERHDGGNYWIGTGGTSSFGNSGFNQNGVKIGGEKAGGGGKTAIWNLGDRTFQAYRHDEAIQVRNLKIALKKLKELRKEGRKEFSIDKTIQKTTDNAGDLELVFSSSRKNKLKLMLLMDVGGSMTPHAERVSKLFSAAHQMNHFKEFHYYYFHNIIYDCVYEDARFQKRIPLDRLFKKISPDTRLIFVGDAAMNPYELFGNSAAFGGFYSNSGSRKSISGIETLELLKDYYHHSIWLNPDDRRYWNSTTCEAIWDRISMYYLSVDGLSTGIKELING
ncbi:MAG: hypothetical protein SFU98_11075 [Leptospiraceae bacterium]|nr:hypothetical protein [Leptospiraceae bacterium]